MPGRKEVKGGAAGLTLVSSITNLSSSCQANGTVTGWPTGASFPFVITIDRGIASEERVLCTSLAGSAPATINFSNRGYDGTGATSHNSGATIEHTLDADTIDSLFAHNFDTTRDDHTQYTRVNGSRAFTALTAIAGTPVAVGTAIAAGTALTLARSDHVHNIGAGAINNSNMFGAGVVNNAALGALAVDTAKIANNAVDAGKINVNALGLGLQLDGSNKVATLTDGSTTDNGGGFGSLRVKPLGVTSGELAASSVINTKIANSAIDAIAKFGAGTRPFTVCTSGTRPGSPNVGDVIYETDTFKTLQYQSATTGWTPFWNMPWGLMGSPGLSSGTASIGLSDTDLAGMAVSWTAVANRRVRASWSFEYSESQPDRLQTLLTDGSNTQLGQDAWVSESNSTIGHANQIGDIVMSAGAVTLKLRAKRISGPGGVFTVFTDSSTQRSRLLVEDMGPSANPA